MLECDEHDILMVVVATDNLQHRLNRFEEEVVQLVADLDDLAIERVTPHGVRVLKG